MSKRKYCLTYLASYLCSVCYNDNDRGLIEKLYDKMVRYILQQPSIKQVWLVVLDEFNAFDIGVQYLMAHQVLERLAKELDFEGRLPSKLPFIENRVVKCFLIKGAWPQEADPYHRNMIYGCNVPRFNKNAPGNLQYLELWGNIRTPSCSCAATVKPGFNLICYCKGAIPVSARFTCKAVNLSLTACDVCEVSHYHLHLEASGKKTTIDLEQTKGAFPKVFKKAFEGYDAIQLEEPLMNLSIIMSYAQCYGYRSFLETFVKQTKLINMTLADSVVSSFSNLSL